MVALFWLTSYFFSTGGSCRLQIWWYCLVDFWDSIYEIIWEMLNIWGQTWQRSAILHYEAESAPLWSEACSNPWEIGLNKFGSSKCGKCGRTLDTDYKTLLFPELFPWQRILLSYKGILQPKAVTVCCRQMPQLFKSQRLFAAGGRHILLWLKAITT